jgi:hypothetical protein
MVINFDGVAGHTEELFVLSHEEEN